MEDSIASAHRSLDELLDGMAAALTAGDEPAAREAFAQLREAFEAHFDQEDHLYYPSIRSLRPELEPSVASFAKEHEAFRGAAGAIQTLLEAGSLAEAQHAFERFRAGFARHEAAEEQMLRSLDQQLGVTA
jgi:hypothetical protein